MMLQIMQLDILQRNKTHFPLSRTIHTPYEMDVQSHTLCAASSLVCTQHLRRPPRRPCLLSYMCQCERLRERKKCKILSNFSSCYWWTTVSVAVLMKEHDGPLGV